MNEQIKTDEESGRYLRKCGKLDELERQVRKYESIIKIIKLDIKREENHLKKINLGKALAGLYKFVKEEKKVKKRLEGEMANYIERGNLDLSEGGFDIKTYYNPMEENE